MKREQMIGKEKILIVFVAFLLLLSPAGFSSAGEILDGCLNALARIARQQSCRCHRSLSFSAAPTHTTPLLNIEYGCSHIALAFYECSMTPAYVPNSGVISGNLTAYNQSTADAGSNKNEATI